MPAAVVLGAAAIGAVASNKAAKKGAAATTKASNQATALEREQFERGIQEVEPFKNLGIGALGNLGEAANQPVDPFQFRDSSQYLGEYFNSPEFNVLNGQAMDQVLRGASATGGLRSGGTNVNLANIAPTLGINALNRVNQQDLQAYGINQSAIGDRFNRLYGVANMGANAASGNQNAGMNFGSMAGSNALTAGSAQAQGYQQQAQAINGLASDASSVYLANRMGLFNQANGAKI